MESGFGESIPLACQDWANTKAAYRFFSNDRVSEEDILRGHFDATRRRFAASDGPILILHDTTEFGLSLHRDKTRLVEFGRFAVMNRCQRGVGKPETFDFLGFTHYCTMTRRGRFRLGRKPVAKRVNRTLARIDEVLRKRWHHDIWEVGKWLGRVCEGWLNYFAVPGSGRFIRAFLRRLQRLWMRALRRRSQRACVGWRRLERMTEILWPRASIRHPWPDQRFAVNHPR